MRRSVPCVLVGLLLAVANGCGGGGGSSQTTTSQAQKPPVSPLVALERAARTAVHENARASDYALIHNTVPSWASQSTSGPALATMRASVAQRQAGRVTVRLLASAVQISSVAVDPSYLTATAKVVERSHLRVYQHGRPVGGVRSLSEPARIELHRIGDKPAFVVWRLTPA